MDLAGADIYLRPLHLEIHVRDGKRSFTVEVGLGVLEFWGLGLGYWVIGLIMYWGFGVLENPGVGVMEYTGVGILSMKEYTFFIKSMRVQLDDRAREKEQWLQRRSKTSSSTFCNIDVSDAGPDAELVLGQKNAVQSNWPRARKPGYGR
ncbi:hypothetical protein PoB_006270500 [Plakobranchus ocellatus]|uniref:Uncharacterized protein n=1 Tax=Plakobranchus ocellatus TaxID=259542 RepID=A0AAV4CWN1_9GAST|nr:hypothetical protein PoB_006270500 [Plakobranchus ocellatus]